MFLKWCFILIFHKITDSTYHVQIIYFHLQFKYVIYIVSFTMNIVSFIAETSITEKLSLIQLLSVDEILKINYAIFHGIYCKVAPKRICTHMKSYKCQQNAKPSDIWNKQKQKNMWTLSDFLILEEYFLYSVWWTTHAVILNTCVILRGTDFKCQLMFWGPQDCSLFNIFHIERVSHSFTFTSNLHKSYYYSGLCIKWSEETFRIACDIAGPSIYDRLTKPNI